LNSVAAADRSALRATVPVYFGHFDTLSAEERSVSVRVLTLLSVSVWLEKCDSLWVYTRGETLYGIYGALSVRRAYRLPLFSSAFM
jgi:hypothetical protein